MSLIDIGANLLDDMFDGVYHGSRKHERDLDAVLDRAFAGDVQSIIVTACSLEEAERAIALCEEHPRLFHTAGVHPTQSDDLFREAGSDADGPLGGEISEAEERRALERIAELRSLVERGAAAGKCVALGECGLDYARLHFAGKERQRRAFELQLALAKELQMPVFLHNRDTEGDFVAMMREHGPGLRGGVVHSFTGSWEECEALLDLGLYIGINGCSLKTEENLEVARRIPTDRLMIETDAPWCGIRRSHASHPFVATAFPEKDKKKWSPEHCVKGRCEPCHLVQVLEVLCAVREEEDRAAFVRALESNTRALFALPQAEGGGAPPVP